jgi:hypothetical protein
MVVVNAIDLEKRVEDISLTNQPPKKQIWLDFLKEEAKPASDRFVRIFPH